MREGTLSTQGGTAGALAAASLVLAACGDGAGPTPPGTTTGTLEVRASTTGDTLDRDGYTVTLDGGDARTLDPAGTVTYGGVPEGDHPVAITGLRPNCAPAGPVPRTVTVPAGDTAVVVFDVACEAALFGRIVFTSDRDGNEEIYAVAADGSGSPTRLTDTPSREFVGSVSPDGTRIAFYGDRAGDLDVFAMDPGGGDVVTLADAGANVWPTWSPGGGAIAFGSDRDGDHDVYAMDADGSDVRELSSDDPSLNLRGDTHPAWSSDGSRVAFQSDRDADLELFVVDADGTGQTRLTENSQIVDAQPSWSPDEARIVFTSDRDGDFDLYVLDPGTGAVERVTDAPGADRSPAWSPDGTRIAFTSTRDGNEEIYLVNADGTDPRRLTDHPGRDNRPAWSPSSP